MLLSEFAEFITQLTQALNDFLPADIVLWLAGLVTLIMVLAVWRMAH